MPGTAGSEHLPPGGEAAPEGMVESALTLEDGYIVIPDVSGIGVTLAEDAEERFPFRPRQVRTRLHADGSVVDQ